MRKIILISLTLLFVILMGCAPSEEKTLANLDTLSDNEFDQTMSTNRESALAGQAGRVKIPLECNVVEDNLILSRGTWSRSLPRFFCSAREGNAQRERICTTSGYTSTLTRCENGCDGITGRCICLGGEHFSINVDINARNGTTYFDFGCYPDYYLRYEGYFLTATNQPISILPKTCGHFNILVVFFDNETNRNLLLENSYIPIEIKEQFSTNLEEGLVDLFESYTPENVFESLSVRPDITFEFDVRVVDFSNPPDYYPGWNSYHDWILASNSSDFVGYDAVLSLEDIDPPVIGLGITLWPPLDPSSSPLLYNTSNPRIFKLDQMWISPGLFYNELFRRNVPVMLAEYIPGPEAYETIGSTTYDRTPFYNPRTSEAIDLTNAQMAPNFLGWYDLDDDGIIDCQDEHITPTAENVDGDFIPDAMDPNLSVDHRVVFINQIINQR